MARFPGQEALGTFFSKPRDLPDTAESLPVARLSRSPEHEAKWETEAIGVYNKGDLILLFAPEAWKGGFLMPIYEFECRECNHKFQQIMSVSEWEVKAKGDKQEGFTCPKCGSKNVEELLSARVQTSKKS